MQRVSQLIHNRFAGHRLEKCVQPDGEQVVLSLYGRDDGDADHKSKKCFLLLSCRPESARVSTVERLPKAPQNPPAFVSWIRAHLKGARLISSSLMEEDRLLALRFQGREGEFAFILALLGTRSNLYITDSEGRILVLLRPAGDTRPELERGSLFVLPGSGIPRLGVDRFADYEDREVLHAIEEHYAAEESSSQESALVREIRQVLKRERKNAARRLEKIEAELAEADRAPELQRHGELLKSSLQLVKPGDSEVRVRDYATGEDVVIPLDPKLDARSNLEAVFKKYKKFLRRLTNAGGQVDAAREMVENLSHLESELDSLTNQNSDAHSAAIETLAERPDLARLLNRRRAATPGKKKSPAPEVEVPKRFRSFARRLHPRRYLSRDGLEIWVGRSDQGNDILSTRIARGSDLFFHLDGAPGSHVVLCTEGRSDPPQESLIDACELAVHFSKQKNAGRADVHVVPIKQVKKPKGAKPGLVWVTGGRSLHLRREENRLARLLDSRIDT